MEKEKKILIKYGLYLLTFMLIIVVGISGVFAQTIQGWAKNVDLYTDVNLLDCSSNSCSTQISLSADYFYDTESLIKYNNFISNSHTIANYGDMILNYHRYLPGYLYSTTSYICFSSNINLTNNNIDLYVGNYNDTINKVGNLTYHNVLVQSLDNHPYSPGDQYGSCYAIVNLFSPSVEGQNIGKVYKLSNSVYSKTYLIGEKFESLGLYSGSIGNSLETIISSSGLATANSVDEIQQDIQEIQTNIIENQNANNNALITNDDKNTDKLIEDNKKTYQTCRDSVNLLDLSNGISRGSSNGITLVKLSDNSYSYVGTATQNPINVWLLGSYGSSTTLFTLSPGTYYINDVLLFSGSSGITGKVNITSTYNVTAVRAPAATTGQTYDKIIYPQIEKGSSFTEYEPYGKEICVNKLDEAETTRKGILGKLGDLISYINPLSENFFVYKLIDLLSDLLKSLFIPSQTFLNNWYSDFKAWIELKLGFLATPITLFLDFIKLFLNLSEENIIINIPQITVPNFEDKVLIQAQTFNWGELLNSKTAFQNLWNLYLDFIDVYLILNFLGLCENKYNRIFGGDTTPYEYYTTEETYTINDETGEATNHQLKQRTTRRKKVT